MQKFSIVSYKKTPAVILEAGEKFLIEYPQYSSKQGGKITYSTQSVRTKDIVFLHKGPLSSVKMIAEQNESLESLAASVEECWELLVSDETTKNETLSIQDISELSIGSYEALSSFSLYSLLLNLPFFTQIETHDQELPSFTPQAPEKVAQLKSKEKDKENEAQKRQEFIKRLKNKNIDLATDTPFMQEIEALALGKTDKSKFLKEAGFSETCESAHSILLQTKFWPPYKNPHPSRWGLSMQSSQDSLTSPPDEERIFLTHKAFAIDSEWSTDPDDAIAFDGTYVWVHVADPASTVLPDSPIDISARNRGSTLYIPEGASRMLSEECLEDYALGLVKEPDSSVLSDSPIQAHINAPLNVKGPISRALSFKILLDENGAIEEVDVLKTMVEIKRLSYDYADTIKTCEELAPLFKIAQKNIERRKKSGAVFIELPEVAIHVIKDSEGKPVVEITESNKTESSVVVREFMLLAGEAASRFAFKNSIPFPFVSQEAPDIPKEIPSGLAGHYRLRRCMRSRSVGVTPSQHAGLGLGMYSQVTSPLRRYGDLVAHQQLRAFIDNKKLLTKDEVLERISAGDAASSAAVKAERKSNQHWTLYYLMQHPDWTGKAVAVEAKGKQFVCLIPSLGMETLITTSANLELNDEIMVKAGKIHISDLTVSFIHSD